MNLLLMKIPTGNLLKAARHAAGLQQAELARAADIDPATLSRMEGAGAEPISGAIRNLHGVLDALRRAGVEIDDDASTIRITGKRLKR